MREIRWMIKQRREEGVDQADCRPESFPAFRRYPLAPFGFEVCALYNAGLEKVGRVEEVCTSA
jgi:hypothetical protein